MARKKILVTGASGLVGNQVLRILKNDHELYGLIRNKPNEEEIIENVQYIHCDLATPDFITKLPNKIDIVIHLAQSNFIRNFPYQVNDNFSVNTQSTAILAEYSRNAGATCFIYTSTGGVYGKHHSAARENMVIEVNEGPLCYYFATKYASECLLKAYRPHLDIKILRPFFVYGEKQRAEMLMPRLVKNIFNEQPIKLAGKEGIILNPIFVNDVARYIKTLLNHEGSIVTNVSGDEQLSIKNIADTIGHKLSREPIFKYEAETQESFLSDNSLMKNILKTPLTPFSEGINGLIKKELQANQVIT